MRELTCEVFARIHNEQPAVYHIKPLRWSELSNRRTNNHQKVFITFFPIPFRTLGARVETVRAGEWWATAGGKELNDKPLPSERSAKELVWQWYKKRLMKALKMVNPG